MEPQRWESTEATLRVPSSPTLSKVIDMLGNIWRLEVPKERLVALIDAMDTDEDGYISFGEVRDLLKEYGVKLKRSMRYSKKR